MRGRHWLLIGMAVCAVAVAGPPPPAAPPGTPQPPSSAGPPPSPPQGAPDEDFIEFLGADDVGDAAWWEFFKKVPLRGENPPATSPQETKQ